MTDDGSPTYRVRVAQATGAFHGYTTTSLILSMNGSTVGGISSDVNFDYSRQVRVADQVRPKNIAVNMFIKGCIFN